MTGVDWPGKFAAQSADFASIFDGSPVSVVVPFWKGPRHSNHAGAMLFADFDEAPALSGPGPEAGFFFSAAKSDAPRKATESSEMMRGLGGMAGGFAFRVGSLRGAKQGSGVVLATDFSRTKGGPGPARN